jgi:hypothetical protein
MDSIFLSFLKAEVKSLTVAKVNVDYFLREINTPDWHWLFRVVFIFGLVLALGVFFYYRSGDSDRK